MLRNLDTLPGPLSGCSPVSRWSYLAADEQNEVARRALVQVLAIRSGSSNTTASFPDRLDELVPDELPSPPNDPYSDRPFGYTPCAGASLLPLKSALAGTLVVNRLGPDHAPAGSWLLYSIGHDRRDDGGTSNSKTFPGRDLVFAIPPVENTPGAGKDKAEKSDKQQASPKKPN